MCQFYSPIVTKKLEILDCFEVDDRHETVISKYELKDDKLGDRDFVRLEMFPKSWRELSNKLKNNAQNCYSRFTKCREIRDV